MVYAPLAEQVIDQMSAWLEAPAEPEPWVVETSGSTGTPKRVLLSRRAMVASAELSARRIGGAGPWLLTVAPTYVAGLNVIARSLLAGHRPVVLADGMDLGAGAEALPGGGRGAFVSMVPTQLARALETHPAELARFHTLLLGGGPIDPALRRRATQAGVRVVATYGSAETSGGCVYDGLPLDGVGLALGADGRVRISGPTLAEGYDDPRLTAETFVEGWFVTSDAGRIDTEGRLSLLGRIDDMVITGGVNVPAPAVAARLRLHDGVAEAEVLGVPDEEWGYRLVAFVVPTAGTDPDPAELGAVLRDWVGAQRPRSWAPRQLVLVEQIPLLANGKTDRMALRRLATPASGTGASV